MAPVDTYWTTQGQTTPDRVLNNATPASAYTTTTTGMPYHLLPGSTGVNIDTPQIYTNAAALFPVFDGTPATPSASPHGSLKTPAGSTVPNSRPSTFNDPVVQPGDFAGWHTAHQIAYLETRGTATTVDDGDGNVTYRYARVGTSSDERNNIHALLSQDGSRVIIINALTRPDIAMLPLDDQRALALIPAFSQLVAEPYSLEPTQAQLNPTPPTVAKTTADIRTEMKTIVQDQIDAIKALITYGDQEAAFNAALPDSTERKQFFHYFFTQQLEALRDNMDAMAVFDRDSITQQVGNILERFERLNRYASITDAPTPGAQPLLALNGTDYNASIASALSLLLRVESKIHEAVLLEEAITDGPNARVPLDTIEPASAARLAGRKLDPPMLTFLLQSLASYRAELDVEARSEELNQQTRLLQDYTEMQKWVNITLAAYDPVKLADPEEDETLPIGGVLSETYAGLYSGRAEYEGRNPDVLSMFDSTAAAANSNTYHPVEVSKNVVRPSADLFSYSSGTTIESALPQYRKSIWDTLATNLSESTKLVNQENQIQMDEINGINKEKNRHYDLASSTLNKMTEMLRSIIT